MGTFERLNAKFDIEEEDVEIINDDTDTTEMVVAEPMPIAPVEQVDKDIETARATIETLIGTGITAVDGIMSIASQSDHPRAYEVAGQMLKTVSDLAKDLVELHKKAKEVSAPSKKEEGPARIKNQQNNIFVGTTQEAMKAILAANT